MKYLHYWIGMTLLLGMPGGVTGAPAKRPEGITRALTNLQEVVAQVEKNRTDEMGTQMDLETRLLGVNGRDQLGNRLDMDSEALSNYVDEGLNDIGYLKEHWRDLTSAEKDAVDEALAEING